MCGLWAQECTQKAQKNNEARNYSFLLSHEFDKSTATLASFGATTFCTINSSKSLECLRGPRSIKKCRNFSTSFQQILIAGTNLLTQGSFIKNSFFQFQFKAIVQFQSIAELRTDLVVTEATQKLSRDRVRYGL